MSYTSLSFILLVGITALIYFNFPLKKYKWTVLLAASFVFYLFVGYRYAFFLAFTALSSYFTALRMDSIGQAAKQELSEHKQDWDRETKKQFKARTKSRKRLVMLFAVLANLGILAFLKYYNFLAGSLNQLLGLVQIPVSAPILKLFLPLGISFYTFQSVGYVVDVYREKIPAERNPAKVLLFLSFFPQIVQGPISFYDQLAHQLYEPHDFSFTRFKYSCELILWGFFKKLVIADRAVILINWSKEWYGDLGGTTLTIIILLYALQLYADFSGGIDISRGVAQLFGIDMIENFKRPYFATTINDYWRRWHISLGAWMKEYVFYPLALSKRFTGFTKKLRGTKFGATQFGAHVAKVLPTSFASLIVFFLVGIWHGASWNYVAFGLWNGGIIMLSTLLEPVFQSVTVKLHLNVQSLGFRVFQMLRTFLVVLIGYVFDVAPSFRNSLRTFYRILTDQSLCVAREQLESAVLGKKEYLLLLGCTLIHFVVSVIQERNPQTNIRTMLDRKPFLVRYFVLLIGILMILLFGVYGPGFDASEFVYMQF